MKTVDTKNVKTKAKSIAKQKNANLAKAKASKNAEKKSSTYRETVLNVHAKFKAEQSTLGGAVKTLINFATETGMNKKHVAYLRLVKKDDTKFQELKEKCRVTAKGNYPIFYVRQAVYSLTK